MERSPTFTSLLDRVKTVVKYLYPYSFNHTNLSPKKPSIWNDFQVGEDVSTDISTSQSTKQLYCANPTVLSRWGTTTWNAESTGSFPVSRLLIRILLKCALSCPAPSKDLDVTRPGGFHWVDFFPVCPESYVWFQVFLCAWSPTAQEDKIKDNFHSHGGGLGCRSFSPFPTALSFVSSMAVEIFISNTSQVTGNHPPAGKKERLPRMAAIPTCVVVTSLWQAKHLIKTPSTHLIKTPSTHLISIPKISKCSSDSQTLPL